MSLGSQHDEKIFVENRCQNLNYQYSSSLDMDFSDAPASSDTQNNHSRKFPVTNASAVLQKAIDALKVNSDLTSPKSEPEWQQLYNNTLFKSKIHALTYEEHMWSWLNLIITAKDLKQPEFEEILLNCYENAIVTLPIKISEDDTSWVALINGLYCHILAAEFKHSSAKSVLESGEVSRAKSVLEAAEKRFKYSPKHARVYWNAVIKNEKQLMKSLGTSVQNQAVHMAGLYKKRYSNPYVNMAEDYNDFVRWSVDVNLPKELRLEVQNAFLQHSVSEKMSFLTSILEKRNPELTAKHHLVFEDWVESLCKEENPNFDKVEISCEEIIAEEPESFCYYAITLHALALPVFEGVSKRGEKICDIIQRGWKNGKTSCETIEDQFLEQSLVIASKTLCVDKVLELVENALTQFPVTADITKWYASSRGIIIAISNLSHGGQLDTSLSSFEKYFEKVISPCTMELYRSSQIPEALTDEMTRCETKYFELVKLWVRTQESCYNLDWPKVVNMWTNIFMNNQSPVMLVGYVDFVKSRGSYEEAFAASSFALEQMFSYELSETVSKQLTRRCYIKLLQDHLEIVSAAGKADQQISTAQKLQRKLNVYISTYGNEFQDLVTSGSMLNGFHPLESIMYTSSSISEKLLRASPLASSSSDSLATKLKPLKLGHDSDSIDRESIDNGKILRGFKVFVSNLNYHANEEDVANAFKDKGFYPLKVEVKRTAQGKSLGHGFAEFDTKDTADLAINMCDKFKVRGRATFVSEFKAGQRLPMKKPPVSEPTILNLANLPPEWKDGDRITNKLSCYGHIKNVTVEDLDESSFTVKVEFHMTDDAKNAYVQIMDRKVFEDTNVSCRIGYAPKKRQSVEEIEDKKKAIRKRQLEGKTNGEEKRVSIQQPKNFKNRSRKEVTEEKDLESCDPSIKDDEGSNQLIGPQVPPSVGVVKKKPLQRPTKGFNPIPTQVRQPNILRTTKRTHMKARLDVGEAASASFSTSPNKVRKIDSEEEANECHDGGSKSSLSGGGDTSGEHKLARMEEEANEAEKPSLSNKDFQNLFKKDS